jgi:hypothetical protein
MATIVLAAATAEAWICAGSTVGVAWAQAELKRRTRAAATNRICFIFSLSPFLLLNYYSVLIYRDE